MNNSNETKLTGYSRFKPMQDELLKLREDNASLLQIAEEAYLSLQIASNKDVKIAIGTDSLRAQLRNTISMQKGIPPEDVQNKCESEALAKAESY